MRRLAALVLGAGSFACSAKATAPFPAPELAAPEPWDPLERICARGDDPPHLERVFVGEEEHEQLLVPVGIEPALGISTSWLALGGEDPGLAPFEWSWLLPQSDDPEASRQVLVAVELVAPNALELTVAPQLTSVAGWVVHARIERRPSGELVGTLEGGWFTDIDPRRGRWDDLRGALRLSTPAWQAPGQAVAVHLELSSATSAVCGQLLVGIPPPGQRRSMHIPVVPTRPSPRYASSTDARP